MARINIEDSIWKDDRFQDLIVAAGGRLCAKGMILELWMLAQEYWFPEKKLIPMERIERAGLKATLDVGLAEVREGGVFAVGTKHAFDWLFQKQKAGEESGKARRAKKEKKRKKTGTDVNGCSTDVHTRSTYVNETEPLTLSSSLFSLSSSSISESKNIAGAISENDSEKDSKPVASADSPTPTALAWRAYKAAYSKRWDVDPAWNAKVAGQLRALVSRIPLESIPFVIEFYLTHPDSFYVKAMHPVGLLLRDAEKLHSEWQRGVHMTNSQAKQEEKSDYHRSQLERIARGEL